MYRSPHEPRKPREPDSADPRRVPVLATTKNHQLPKDLMIINFLRWITMPIIALCTALVGGFIVRSAMMSSVDKSNPAWGDGFYVGYIIPIVQATIIGFLSVFVAAKVAPNHKKACAAWFSVVLSILSIAFTVYCWASDSISKHDTGLITLWSISLTISSIVSAYSFCDD